MQSEAAMPSNNPLVAPFQAFTAFGTGSNSQTPPAKVPNTATLLHMLLSQAYSCDSMQCFP